LVYLLEDRELNMPNDDPAFAIDDGRTTEENLAVFGQLLHRLDTQLGPALAVHLSGFAKGQSPDAPALWDQLYAATKPVQEGEPGNDDVGDQAP
jgi:hypothetical protein